MSTTQQSVRKAIPKLNNTVLLYAYKAANQSALTGNSWNKINLDTVSYDAGKNFDTTNYKFTAPMNALYRIKASVFFTTVTTATKYLAAIYKNGSAIKYEAAHAGLADDLSVELEIEVFLNTNDYIELYAEPALGANTVAAKGGIEYTFLNIRLVTKEGIRQ